MSKNIVICCDGTNKQFGGVETNVVAVWRALAQDSARQRAFYEPGVGTFAPRMLSRRVGRWLGKLLGAAFGYGIQQNMANAYRFLVQVFEPGDRVFLLGFSRGAFTARSLASLVDRCGILPAADRDASASIVKAYLDRDADCAANNGMRRCRPHFVGVWDTVGALGLILRLRRFADNRLSPGVTNALQALAIDEKRAPFKPSLWDESRLEPDQNVEQVWFAGVHGDIGGGYRQRGLSDITLRWMLEHSRRQGLELAPETLADLRGDPEGRLHHSYTGLWRLLGAHTRHIPADALVDASVRARLRSRLAYDPPNLPRIG